MEGADGLGLIAEVGIAIAGFAGIVATLRAPHGKMVTLAALRIGFLLGQSATAVLLALLPFALHYAGLSNSGIWAISSSGMAALLLLMASLPTLTFSGIEIGDRAPTRQFVVPIGYAVLIGNVVLQLTNVAFFRELWPFYIGLLITTAMALFMFADVLFAPSRAEVQA